VKPSKIILTGGGTAGHVTPNLALLPLLEKEGHTVSYIGTKAGIEKELTAPTGIPYYGISAGKLRRYFSLRNFIDPFKIAAGYFQSKRILRKERPDLVFSKGGFVTVPVVFAAHSLKIPVVLHESDYTPGLANKLCIPKADKVCVSFSSAAAHIPASKCVLTGSPVRQELFAGSREEGLAYLGFDDSKPVLLIMGGSLGAQAVNDAVDASLAQLLELFQIAHIRGAGKLNPELEGKAGYRQFEYVEEQLTHIFAATDLMLSRAGANAIFEILALRIPALLVPLPKESSRGDQVLNAAYFEKQGFSMVLDQKDVTEESLVAALRELLAKQGELKAAMEESGLADGTGNVLSVIKEELEKA